MRRLAAVAAMLLSACGGGSPTGLGPGGGFAPPPGPANVAGSYTFTFTASTVCTQIPTAFRRRIYPAAITQSGTAVAVSLTGRFGSTLIRGTVSGNSVFFDTIGFGELISDTSGFVVVGSGTATVSGTTLAGTLNGSVDYFDVLARINVSCSAVDHQISFVR